MCSMTTSDLAATDRQHILARYQRRFAEHGPSVTALASGSAEKQALRHRILREIGIQKGDSVLDVGCGLGHFLQNALDAKLPIAYTGLDLVPEFITHCRAMYTGQSTPCQFVEADLFAEGCAAIRQQPPHDWVIASQVFNNRYAEGDNWSLFEQALSAMFGRCQRGVAIDCLTTRVDFQEPQLHYFDPARLLTFGLFLSRQAILRHDYPLYEQTLYLYRVRP